jgi:membrane protease YdiL (CAAX protease family)
MGLTDLAPNFTLGTGAALVLASRSESLLLLIPVLAILPGVSEELFFRGMLQRAFANSALSVVGVSVVFALYHLDPPHVVATLPVGLYLGWLALRSNSSLLPVGVHVLNNTLAIMAVRSETLSFGYGTDQAVPVGWLVGSLVLAAFAVVALWRGTRNSAR